MKRFFKFFIGLGILAFAIACVSLLWITRPEAEKEEEIESFPVVEVLPVTITTETFEVPSQGIVQADRRTMLASELSGKIEEVSPVFEMGNAVAKGTVLLKIDQSNYKAAAAQAKSALADAVAALESEKARAAQAERDWKNLGRGGKPSDLVLRRPQLAGAEARVESAKANLKKAEIDLERTSIKAPFDSIIASTMTEVGSYLAPGATVAELFETDPYEVHLPLSVDELAFLETDKDGNLTGDVTLSATASGITRTWPGRIVRTSGEIDRATRSLHLIVEIGKGATPAGIVMRPGLFVEASIKGRSIPNVAAIPFRSFLDLDKVVTVDPDNKLRFRTVDVIHREGDLVYVAGGEKDNALAEGQRVCLTELPDLIEGMRVEPKIVTNQNEEAESSSQSKVVSEKP